MNCKKIIFLCFIFLLSTYYLSVIILSIFQILSYLIIINNNRVIGTITITMSGATEVKERLKNWPKFT